MLVAGLISPVLAFANAYGAGVSAVWAACHRRRLARALLVPLGLLPRQWPLLTQLCLLASPYCLAHRLEHGLPVRQVYTDCHILVPHARLLCIALLGVVHALPGCMHPRARCKRV